MTQHADILDQQDSMLGPFFFAVGLHVTVVTAIAIYGLASSSESFGAKDAGGGAIGIEAVESIPLQHPAKPVERQKEEKPPPDAIALKSRKAKKPLAQVASERQRFRPFKEIEPNQVFSPQAPAVSNPMFSAMPGSGPSPRSAGC